MHSVRPDGRFLAYPKPCSVRCLTAAPPTALASLSSIKQSFQRALRFTALFADREIFSCALAMSECRLRHLLRSTGSAHPLEPVPKCIPGITRAMIRPCVQEADSSRVDDDALRRCPLPGALADQIWAAACDLGTGQPPGTSALSQ